jgi:mono/diheme cytochrome c family protein
MNPRPLAVFLILLCTAALMQAADGSWLHRVPAADRVRTNPLAGEPEAALAGSHLFAAECAKCHGDRGQGKGSRPPVVSDRIAHATDGELAWILKNGNPWKGMPAWSSLPDSERWQLVAFLRSLNQPASAPAQGEMQ